jgi:SseB protein C-terminal domain
VTEGVFLVGGNVERAYLVEMYDPKSGEPPHQLILISAKAESPKGFPEIAPETGAVIKQVARENEFFDMMDLSRSKGIGDNIAKSVEPFYP